MTAEKTKQDSAPQIKGTRSIGAVVEAYSENALLVNQPRLTDLIPLSRWAYIAMFLLGAVSIYLLQLGYVQTAGMHGSFPTELFALNGTGTLASWLNSLLLLMLCAGCVQVFLLRRFKADDYKGRYRLWLWMAFFSALLSFEAATGAHRIFQPLVDRWAFGHPWSQAAIWWMLVVSLISIYLGVRLLFELTASLGSFTLLIVSAIGYGAVICSRIPIGSQENYLTSSHGQSMTLLGSNLMLLMMVWVYARSVYLTAQGGRRAALLSQANDGCELTVTGQETNTVSEKVFTDGDPSAESPWADEQWDDLDEDDSVAADEVEDHEAAERSDEEYDEMDLNGEQELDEQAYESVDDADEYDETFQYAEQKNIAARQTGQRDAGQSAPDGGDCFDENAFWDAYDLTSMSRKQLRKTRKKLNRLKRQFAAQSDARAA